MQFFLNDNETECGPFTWGQVFVLLRKYDLDESTLARCEPGSETKSLQEWGFWSEGTTIRSLSWEEIQDLLTEGVIDEDVYAQLDGNDDESVPLWQLIEQCHRTPSLKGFNSGQLATLLLSLKRWWGSIPANKRWIYAGGVSASATAVLVSVFLIFANGTSTPLLESSASIVNPPLHSQPPTPSSPPNSVENSEIVIPVTQPATLSNEKDEEEAKPSLVDGTGRTALPTLIPASQVDVAHQKEPQTSSLVVESNGEDNPIIVSSSTTEISPMPPEQDSDQPKTIESAQQAIPDAGRRVPEPETIAAPLPSPTTAQKSAATAQTPRSAQVQQPSPVSAATVAVSDFFKIEGIRLHKRPPRDGYGLWKDPVRVGDVLEPPVFVPSFEVKVQVAQGIRSDRLVMRMHFYDSAGNLVETQKEPANSGKLEIGKKHRYPVLFDPSKPADNRFLFEAPSNFGGEISRAIVVFGDKHELQAQAYPQTTSTFLLNYPEKAKVEDKRTARIVRKPALDPLIEHVVKTKNPKMPQMTLFFRPPRNVTDSSEIRGVMALCLLAGSLDEIRRELQKEEMTGDNKGILGFADKNKLAILAWGANSSLWARANYDQLTRKQAREYESSFGIVANAWERGVLELGEKYGMPTKGFLIQGQCGSAHLAKALCLAKPEYFLAIHIHIPGFFEAPTPEASRVLWCITTGELYYSYDYSLRFLEDSRKLGYPILYKAFVGLGHAGHPDATALGLEFFQFALTQQSLVEELERKRANAIDSVRLSPTEQSGILLESFKNPPLYGDIVNQEVFPADQVDMIPEGFRIAIPTKELGAIWKRNP